MRKPLIAAILLLSLFMASCSGKEVKLPLPGINTVKAGEEFYINLPENHTEFFIWKLNREHNRQCIEDYDAVWHGNEKGVYYNFKALAPGTDTLKFALYKYNELNKAISFVVKVE